MKNKLNVYEVEYDYTYICAETPERAKEIYMDLMRWNDKDWESESGDTVCPIDELEPMSEEELKLNRFNIESGGMSFYKELQNTDKECVFASCWE